MMKLTRGIFFLIVVALFAACTSTSSLTKTTFGAKDGKVEWIILQMNDVYEIAAIENGKAGGLARVASLKQQLLKENPNVYTVMAGDFLSPSVIGTLKYEGSSIKGKQMVDALNAVGLNMTCFGNHEFDLDYPDLQKRFDESKFDWLSSNAFQTNAEGEIKAFGRTGDEEGFPEYKVLTINDGKTGESCKVGIWGCVLPSNKKDYVYYVDEFERANTLVDSVLAKEVDVICGLTHLTIDQDKELAKQNPTVTLIMGGHEHNNMRHLVGNTVITKADANAKTVYVHRFSYDLKSKKTILSSELVKIDETIAADPSVAAVVKKWSDIANASLKSNGFDATEVVADISEALDGREASLRLTQTNLGSAIAKSMTAAAKKPVDCTFFNSGSIRIDDQVSGKITQTDIIRIMPFGGKMVEFDIKGSELKKVLYAGLLSKGRGGYLQWDKITYKDADKSFTINGLPLDDNKVYHCATNDFLLSGKENNFDFFNEKNPNISNIDKTNDVNDLRFDIRKVFISYLKTKK